MLLRKKTIWVWCSLLLLLMGCQMDEVEQQLVQLRKEYGADSTKALLVKNLQELDVDTLWVELFQASFEQEYDKALVLALRLLELEADNDEVYHEMGYCLSQKQQYTAAALMYAKAISLNENSDASYYNLGEIYILHRHYHEAQQALERAYQIDSQEDKYALQLAKVYLLQEKYTAALELYLSVLEHFEAWHITPEPSLIERYQMYIDIYYDLALLYWLDQGAKGKVEQYLAYYERWIINDTQAQTLRNIMYG